MDGTMVLQHQTLLKSKFSTSKSVLIAYAEYFSHTDVLEVAMLFCVCVCLESPVLCAIMGNVCGGNTIVHPVVYIPCLMKRFKYMSANSITQWFCSWADWVKVADAVMTCCGLVWWCGEISGDW